MPQDRNEISILMDRASSGDDEAFGAMAEAMQDELFRFGLAQGLRYADAADATQETLMRAYRGRSRWRTGSDATAWLYGIAMNVIRERRRKRSRQPFDGFEPDSLPGTVEAEAAANGEWDEGLGRLARAVAALPARQQEAVACRYLRQMSVRETAATMGCAEGTVKAAVFAAIENLKKAMVETR